MRKVNKKRVGVVLLLICSIAILIGLYNVNDSKNRTVVRSESITLEQKNAAEKKEEEVIYNKENQNKIKDYIEEEKKKDDYDENNMLILYNPYGTNTQSLYTYFKTKKAVSVSYNIHVENEKIADFSRELYNAKGEFNKEHEYQILGLIPNTENEITFTFKTKRGKEYSKKVTYKMGDLKGKEELILATTKGKSTNEMSKGLFAILGNDSKEKDFMYYYDNDGVLRSEIPILDYRSHRIIMQKDKMYYSIEEKKMAEVNSLGQVTNVFDTGKYELHHDYVFDDDGNILILATDTTKKNVQDIILSINVTTGEIKEIIDLGDLFSSYKAIGKSNKKGSLDWIHINTIQWMGNDEILLSARETSSIIKISNIFKEPKIEYMLGEKTFWEGYEYEKYLYEKEGDFPSQTGQHTVTYAPDENLGDSQYYIYMYNNNSGISVSRPDYDWSNILGVSEGFEATKDSTSKYYKYLVDENKKTYKLVNSFDVPYSAYISSTQEIEDNVVVNSGTAFTYGEYDKDNELIKSFKMNGESFIYRVYKYTFDNFYFK